MHIVSSLVRKRSVFSDRAYDGSSPFGSEDRGGYLISHCEYPSFLAGNSMVELSRGGSVDEQTPYEASILDY